MSFVGKVGVPCSVLNTCKRLSHFIPMTVLGGGYYYYPHTVAFQDHMACKWWVWGSRKLMAVC